MVETWLPVPRYEDLYEVSDLGRVRTMAGHVLSERRWGHYLVVTLRRNDAKRTKRVHKLVLDAFRGPMPAGMIALHGPAGKLINSLDNLRYGTWSENQVDRFRDGTDAAGEKQWAAKLTAQQVADIRERYARGERQRVLAREYGIAQAHVSRIVNYRKWAHA